MKAGHMMGATGALAVLSLLAAAPARPDVFMYYDNGSDPCYSADFAYSRYSVRFDPADFGLEAEFAIVKVFANAAIPSGVPVPLTIADVSPQLDPDSVGYRGVVTFSPAAWDTFSIPAHHSG
jgi:hypothetical protein